MCWHYSCVCRAVWSVCLSVATDGAVWSVCLLPQTESSVVCLSVATDGEQCGLLGRCHRRSSVVCRSGNNCVKTLERNDIDAHGRNYSPLCFWYDSKWKWLDMLVLFNKFVASASFDGGDVFTCVCLCVCEKVMGGLSWNLETSAIINQG